MNYHNPSDEAFLQALEEGLSEIGISYSSEHVQKLIRYAAEIVKWNQKINLVGDPDILNRHILDSLAAYPYVKRLNPQSICDVGTGAGLPGIPLAIILDDVSVALNDKMGKRVGFLRNMLPILGLSKRVTLLNTAVEKVSKEFDLVTLRAFKGFPECLCQIAHCVAPEGHVMAFLGDETTSDAYTKIQLKYSFLTGSRHLGIMSAKEIEEWKSR